MTKSAKSIRIGTMVRAASEDAAAGILWIAIAFSLTIPPLFYYIERHMKKIN